MIIKKARASYEDTVKDIPDTMKSHQDYTSRPGNIPPSPTREKSCYHPDYIVCIET